MTLKKNIDPGLEDWPKVRGDLNFTGILIGNGASLAIWDLFGYDSLFDVAAWENALDKRLSDEDMKLFNSFETRNFEQVLGALATSGKVMKELEIDYTAIKNCYISIRNALVEAIRSKHIPWHRLIDSVKSPVQEHLLEYKFVYSTNYDLLLYWSILFQNRPGFKDLFWSDYFDLSNTEVWDDCTVILYLHGALHLCRMPDGRTRKRRRQRNDTLLEQFGSSIDSRLAQPLFVAEGTSQDKLTSIRRSDYLSFAYRKFIGHAGPLCIFGHSLGDTDEHLADAIKRSKVQDLAFSLRPGPDEKVIAAKAAVIKRFPTARLRFYDSTTHPLGSTNLRIATGN